MMQDFDPQAYWQTRGASYAVTTAKIEAEMAHLAAWLAKCNPDSILDVGSGWGRVYLYLKEHGLKAAYTMVDFADSMRQGCQRRTGTLPDAWGGKALPYPNKAFDLVLSVDVLLHIPPADIERVFAEHVRVSRRWLYVTTSGTIYRPLARHCFWHDYLKLFSDNKLYVTDAKFWQRGMRIHWILEKFG